MAKQQVGKGISRSQHIRNYLAKHPNAKPKEIILSLKQTGVVVSPGLVASIKYSKPKGSGGRTVKRRVVRQKQGRPIVSGLTADDLFQAKQFADAVGGIDSAKRALDVLDQLL